MKIYRIEANLLAPLALKRDRQSDRSETVRSIPGTTVRGALANAYLQQHGEVDSVFHRLFLDEAHCRFGPLDPGPHFFPATVSACKRFSKDHPKVDQLWFRAAQHLTGNCLAESVHQRFRQCHVCGTDMKGHVGFWEHRDSQIAERDDEQHQVSAHVGIDRGTFTAADGMFYTLEAIAPRDDAYDLIGWIQLTDDARLDLDRLLHEEVGVVYLGHHRTRGYGKVRLTIGEDNLGDGMADNQSGGWQQWSDAMIQFVRDVCVTSDAESTTDRRRTVALSASRDFLFSISLPDGAILVDHLLRYTADPAAMIDWLPPLPDPARLFPVDERLAAALPGGGTLQCVAAVTNEQLLRGWNAAHGLPRQDEWMVARGSVYVYRFQGSQEDRGDLHRRLTELAAAGIGLRRNEGYGRIAVSDPIHSTLALQETPQ
ncbi:MAG: RAMP superfamily CRISPR-associated protein [Candidatus Paceibacterota bacterium]